VRFSALFDILLKEIKSGGIKMEPSKGLEYLKKGKFEEAAKSLEAMIEADPKNPVHYINFGNLLSAVHEHEKAIHFFDRALSLNENAAAALYGAGIACYHLEQYSKAAKLFQEAIKCGLQDGDTHFMAGMSFVSLGENRLAFPYLMRAAELNSEDHEALFQFGLCQARTGDIQTALNTFEKVVKQHEKHTDAWYNLGVTLTYFDRDAEALQAFEKALAIQPDHYLAGNGKRNIENKKTNQ
jgi:tetratricopeptide (TPR) repeat protein